MPGFRIRYLFAFIAADDKGDEGLVAFMRAGSWVPMVAADQSRLDSLMREAQKIADHSGRGMRIVQFGMTEEIGTVEPRKLGNG